MSRESFVGIADTPRIMDTNLSDTIFPRYIHGSSKPSNKVIYTILTILVSAIIFIAVVSVYDMIRAIINGHFRRRATLETTAVETDNVLEPQTLSRSKARIGLLIEEITERNTLKAVTIFTLFCVATALVFVPYIIYVAKDLVS